VHSQSTIARVLALRDSGLGARRIAKRTSLPVATVSDWIAGKVPRHSRNVAAGGVPQGTCEHCGQPEHRFPELPPEYVYLLGLYLGDGCISSHPRGVFRLRIFLDLCYPMIIEDCAAAIAAVMPHNRVHRLARWSNYVQSDEPSHVQVSAFSKGWPCLLPQHGPGKKHDRPIFLAHWQLELVARRPDQLLRGLIHSDGCRFINTGRGNWACPRYTFSNKSDDIRGIFGHACDEFGVHWTASGKDTIYISRKADVARLDEFIGPKR
jgi:hypothetical protein